MQNLYMSSGYVEFNIKFISEISSSANKITELTSKHKAYTDILSNPCQFGRLIS